MNRLKQCTKKALAGSITRLMHRANRTEGGALVEMAVTLPLILLIMTGIFSFSVALHQKLLLSEAVSNAGRTLAIERGQTDPCADTYTALTAAAPTLDPSQLSVSMTLKSGGTSYANSCSGSGSAMSAGDTAQIVATYPCVLGVYGVSFSRCQLRSQISEVVQ
jgi:Flp pilus assembly protein TadG